jgi:hypothetical protein
MAAFNNTEPRTREERVVYKSREKLEKSMLKARRGCFLKYEEAGNPVLPEAATPAYSDEANRFKRDVAADIHQQKMEAWHRQQVWHGRSLARTQRALAN